MVITEYYFIKFILSFKRYNLQLIILMIVGQTSFADCLHIAFATINHADLLISRNFKHIVNIQRLRGYNAVNKKSEQTTRT